MSKGLSAFNPPDTMPGISDIGPQQVIQVGRDLRVYFVAFTMGLPLDVQCTLLCKPGSIFIKRLLFATPNIEALNSADKHRLLC